MTHWAPCQVCGYRGFAHVAGPQQMCLQCGERRPISLACKQVLLTEWRPDYIELARVGQLVAPSPKGYASVRLLATRWRDDVLIFTWEVVL